MNVRRCKIRDILDQIDRDVTYFMPDELLIAMGRSKTVVRRLVRCRTMTLSQYDNIRDALYRHYMSDNVISNKIAKFETLERSMERKRRKETINRPEKHKPEKTVKSSIEESIANFFKIDMI